MLKGKLGGWKGEGIREVSQGEGEAQQEFATGLLRVREQVLGELWCVLMRVQSYLDPVKRNDGLAANQGVQDLEVHR